MSRTQKEIMEDVYYKKIEMRFYKLHESCVVGDMTGREVFKNINELVCNMAAACPQHMECIKECVTAFMGIIEIVTDVMTEISEVSE